MNDVSFRQRNPRLVHLIRNYLAGIVLGMTGLIALLGYIGLEKLYENANQNLERTIRDRYKAEIQHVVETVAATIEATVPGEIGPELSLIQQEAVKRIIRGAKFESSTMKPDVWNGYFFSTTWRVDALRMGPIQRLKDKLSRRGKILVTS